MHFNTLIIMNEDTLGYGNRSRKPSGYCKLATPNRVMCYAQGLRQLPQDQTYKLYLTSKSREKAVEVGSFQVGTSGNKESRWNIDPLNINRSGINAKEVDGALILVDSGDSRELVVPLVGFVSQPYDWARLIERDKQEAPKMDIAERRPSLSPKEVEKEDSRQTSALESRVKELEDSKKQLEETIKGLERELERNQSAGKIEKTLVESNSAGIDEYVSEFIRKFQTDKVMGQKSAYEDIGSVFEKRIPINPFEAQNTGIKWVRITYEDLSSFELLDDEWLNQPLILNANRDYKHFILGRDELALTYYIGIPGVYNSNKNCTIDIDKIERFSCCHNIQPRTGAVGYWIARM